MNIYEIDVRVRDAPMMWRQVMSDVDMVQGGFPMFALIVTRMQDYMCKPNVYGMGVPVEALVWEGRTFNMAFNTRVPQ